MAPVKFGVPMKRSKTLAQRQAKADEDYYRQRQEFQFIAALSAFGDDILGTPIETQAPLSAIEEDSSSEDGGYELCTGYCGRLQHHEDTDEFGACGRCQAESVLRHINRPSSPCNKRAADLIDLSEDTDEEDDLSGYQSPVLIRCVFCAKSNCSAKGYCHKVIDLTLD